MKTMLGLALCLVSAAALSVPCESSLYDKEGEHPKLLFKWKREEPGPGVLKMTFLNLDGSVAVQEDAKADGIHIKSYDLDHKQIGAKGSLKIVGDKVQFSYTKEGKTETATEDLEENLVVGPTIVDYLKAHWAEILKGDTVSVRYAALDRKETVGFKFFKVEEKIYKQEPAIVVKMKPSSFVIAAIVDPLFFTMRKSDARLLYLVGRTLPKRKDGDKWKDLDVQIEYFYPNQG